MSWTNIKLIFLREVRDQFRDRRTIFMVAILPLLLYPALGLGMLQMAVLFSEQPRTVVILGAEHLPRRPELTLLDGNRFASGWFNNPADADKLDVITDLARNQSDELDEARRRKINRLLSQAERLREPVAERRRIKETIARLQRRMLELEIAQSDAREAGDPVRVDELAEQMRTLAQQIRTLNHQLVPIEHRISELFAQCDMDVLLIIPEGFG
ncbi:MAG TPA: CPBP family intramembrane metalloprotease domain-containing protein, partial [Planctomycetaceae bacterium]|nr:CPBP family intramembrane metalloprotease domain-containing protein [Planctomycetaceae bacterium]